VLDRLLAGPALGVEGVTRRDGIHAELLALLQFGAMIVASAALIGFAAAAILILVLALPPLLSKPEDVPRMAAGMFTISYSCAVVVPIVSGLAWDATDVPAALDLIHAILENVAHFTLCPSELRRRCYAQRLILSHGSSACPSELNQTS